MKVRLTNRWFDQNAKRWRPGIHDMPDHYEEFLPKGAEILDDKMNKVLRVVGKQQDPRPDPLNVERPKTGERVNVIVEGVTTDAVGMAGSLDEPTISKAEDDADEKKTPVTKTSDATTKNLKL